MDKTVISAAAAGTWRLGDMDVSRLGFGAMRLTGSLPFEKGAPSDRARSIATLRRAVELGVNHIDTASFYFSALRSANELINAALGPYDDGLAIVTKVGPGRDPSGEWYSARPNQLRGQVEENLRQLGRDHLDVVNLRRMRQESIAEHFGALAELRDAGLIRHLGVSDVSVTQLQEALAIAPVACVQNRYSLELREHDPVLRACAERSIAFVPFFSIAGGQRQAGGAGSESPAVLDVARRHGATPAQVRLAWTLQQAPNVLVIPGTGNPDHVTENVAAAALELSAEDMALLGGAAVPGSSPAPA
jgi:pyridoxine 4-dehydrogenase